MARIGIKVLHFLIGHKELLVHSMEIEGGFLRLYACDCGKTRWSKQYRLSYLAKKFEMKVETEDIFKRESSILKMLPFKQVKQESSILGEKHGERDEDRLV